MELNERHKTVLATIAKECEQRHGRGVSTRLVYVANNCRARQDIQALQAVIGALIEVGAVERCKTVNSEPGLVITEQGKRAIDGGDSAPDPEPAVDDHPSIIPEDEAILTIPAELDAPANYHADLMSVIKAAAKNAADRQEALTRKNPSEMRREDLDEVNEVCAILDACRRLMLQVRHVTGGGHGAA